MKNQSLKWITTAAMVFALSLPAGAAQIIVNGGFESFLSGWSIDNQQGSVGGFALQTGTTNPQNAVTVPAPPEGSNAAMSGGEGPGSHVLYQSFTISQSVGSALLSFSLFLDNQEGAFYVPNPATLDFSGNFFNQQFRVDVMKDSATPFSVAGTDILANVYQTASNDPATSGYTTVTFDLTSVVNANLGTALRLRFAEVDNANLFSAGVDAVSLVTTDANSGVPEPSSWLTMACGLAGLGAYLRRRKR